MRAFLATLACAFALAGCASSVRAPAAPLPPTPSFERDVAGTRVIVRIDKGGEVDADSAPFPFVAWVVAAPVGAVVGAPLTSGLSVVAVPMVVASDAWLRLMRTGIGTALAETPLVPATGQSLVRRLEQRPVSGLTSVVVAIRGFGLRAQGEAPNLTHLSAPVCFSLDASVTLDRADTSRMLPLTIGPANPSPDLPPPVCGTLSAFGADDGALLRQASREAAALVAAWALVRAREGT